MALSLPTSIPRISRRQFLVGGACGAAGLALYSGEGERHWLEITERDFFLSGLSMAFNGMRIVQLSDIHLDHFTEPFFLRHVIDRVNALKPDLILLTGDFVTAELHTGRGPRLMTTKSGRVAAWQCAGLLTGLDCKEMYAVLGNHDIGVGPKEVVNALETNGITVLRNACTPIERAGARLWLAGIDDPLEGQADPGKAIPESIRNVPSEPVILMCHGPDYADYLLGHPAGQAVDMMLSGHSHGGQVRLPFLGAVVLPPYGRKYVEGWFRLGRLQLYVNRGIGTVGLPFRLNCPPEISLFTLRSC
jgi:uncharacterized protein